MAELRYRDALREALGACAVSGVKVGVPLIKQVNRSVRAVDDFLQTLELSFTRRKAARRRLVIVLIPNRAWKRKRQLVAGGPVVSVRTKLCLQRHQQRGLA